MPLLQKHLTAKELEGLGKDYIEKKPFSKCRDSFDPCSTKDELTGLICNPVPTRPHPEAVLSGTYVVDRALCKLQSRSSLRVALFYLRACFQTWLIWVWMRFASKTTKRIRNATTNAPSRTKRGRNVIGRCLYMLVISLIFVLSSHVHTVHLLRSLFCQHRCYSVTLLLPLSPFR